MFNKELLISANKKDASIPVTGYRKIDFKVVKNLTGISHPQDWGEFQVYLLVPKSYQGNLDKFELGADKDDPEFLKQSDMIFRICINKPMNRTKLDGYIPFAYPKGPEVTKALVINGEKTKQRVGEPTTRIKGLMGRKLRKEDLQGFESYWKYLYNLFEFDFPVEDLEKWIKAKEVTLYIKVEQQDYVWE